MWLLCKSFVMAHGSLSLQVISAQHRYASSENSNPDKLVIVSANRQKLNCLLNPTHVLFGPGIGCLCGQRLPAGIERCHHQLDVTHQSTDAPSIWIFSPRSYAPRGAMLQGGCLHLSACWKVHTVEGWYLQCLFHRNKVRQFDKLHERNSL